VACRSQHHELASEECGGGPFARHTLICWPFAFFAPAEMAGEKPAK
jgi:hypothetical protein